MNCYPQIGQACADWEWCSGSALWVLLVMEVSMNLIRAWYSVVLDYSSSQQHCALLFQLCHSLTWLWVFRRLTVIEVWGFEEYFAVDHHDLISKKWCHGVFWFSLIGEGCLGFYACGQESSLLLPCSGWLQGYGMERGCFWWAKIEDCSRGLAVEWHDLVM